MPCDFHSSLRYSSCPRREQHLALLHHEEEHPRIPGEYDSDSDQKRVRLRYLNGPCMIPTQPVFIHMTDASSQHPNSSQDKGYMQRE